MGFRFRRSVKLLPGVRVNFGMRGASLSVGGRGGRMTFSRHGTRASVGIPGTGISYSQRVDQGFLDRKQAREQRLAARAAERAEKEAHRAEALSDCKAVLKEDGRLEIENAFGEPITGADLRLVWEQQGATFAAWLDEQAAKINAESSRLTQIHEDTPSPDDRLTFERVPFDEPEPVRPQFPAVLAARPEQPLLQRPGLLHRLFPWWFGRRLERHNSELLQRHEAALQDWQRNRTDRQEKEARALAEWARTKEDWERRRTDHEREQARLEAQWQADLQMDVGVMEDTLDGALSLLEWPLETEVDFAIEDGGATVWLDVDLPEIEDMATRVASVASTGKRLNIRQKSQSQLRVDYALHIHGIAFRLAGIVFASLPACRTAIISGYSQRPNNALGTVDVDYLYSVRIDRAGFAETDFDSLERVDPMVAISRFEPRRKMTKTCVFQAIEPLTRADGATA